MTTCPAAAPPWPGPAQGRAFGQFQYPTVPLHLTAEDAREVLAAAGFLTGREVQW
jgi:hypothetical protein